MAVKQIIIMRYRDLPMPKGKMVGQGGHAAEKGLVNLMEKTEGDTSITWTLTVEKNSPMAEWMTNGLSTKIVLEAKSEAQLLDIERKAKEAGLNTALITDHGLTVFDGVPTITCLSIGPDDSEKIDAITKRLQLLKD